MNTKSYIVNTCTQKIFPDTNTPCQFALESCMKVLLDHGENVGRVNMFKKGDNK